jgi:hypothetical protein
MLAAQVSAKIERVHGGVGELSPRWRPLPDEIGSAKDRWLPRLKIAAMAASALALVLYIGFAIALRAGRADLAALAGQLVR